MDSLYRTLTGQSQKSQYSDGPSSSTDPVLTKTTTTDPLSGVLNHLTPGQEQKLEDFKALLQKEGWWSPEALNGKPSHDDGTLLRYLRARKFDVSGAYAQFTDTEKWLKEQRVEELYEHFDVEIYERARLMYPQWTGHRDRRGIPIYVYVIKGLDGKNVSKYQKESQHYKDSLPTHRKLATPAKLIPLFALYHNLLNFVLPFVSTLERPNPEIPVTNSTNIVDITGVGLTQFWNLKGHMQDASVLATAHYPETLDRIFIIGAPSFFPTVWSWIKRWFDPVTVSKIFILAKHEVRPTLERFMHPEDFPKRYGGHLDWEWGQVPHLDDESREALERDGNKGWMKGPALWLNHQRVLVGSENGKLRRPVEEIEQLKPVVYAADGTPEPVHPNARKTSAMYGASKAPNGTLAPPGAMKRPSSQHAITAAQAAATTTTATTEALQRPQSNATLPAAVEPIAPTPDSTTAAVSAMASSDSKPAAPGIQKENIRSAPMDGAQVNVPKHQPGFPETTVEYISTDKAAKTNGSATGPAPAPAAAAPPAPQPDSKPSEPTPAPTISEAAPLLPSTTVVSPPESTSSTTTSSGTSSPHPPSHPLPGPASKHQAAVTQKITEQLQGESISSIPATMNGSANGDIPHPEVIVSSDRSKGLAVEAEKMRPGMERFVTAAEIPVQVGGNR